MRAGAAGLPCRRRKFPCISMIHQTAFIPYAIYVFSRSPVLSLLFFARLLHFSLRVALMIALFSILNSSRCRCLRLVSIMCAQEQRGCRAVSANLHHAFPDRFLPIAVSVFLYISLSLSFSFSPFSLPYGSSLPSLLFSVENRCPDRFSSHFSHSRFGICLTAHFCLPDCYSSLLFTNFV